MLSDKRLQASKAEPKRKVSTLPTVVNTLTISLEVLAQVARQRKARGGFQIENEVKLSLF